MSQLGDQEIYTGHNLENTSLFKTIVNSRYMKYTSLEDCINDLKKTNLKNHY